MIAIRGILPRRSSGNCRNRKGSQAFVIRPLARDSARPVRSTVKASHGNTVERVRQGAGDNKPPRQRTDISYLGRGVTGDMGTEAGW